MNPLDADVLVPDIDIDEGALLIVPILIVAAGLLGAVYVIYAAPALFADSTS